MIKWRRGKIKDARERSPFMGALELKAHDWKDSSGRPGNETFCSKIRFRSAWSWNIFISLARFDRRDSYYRRVQSREELSRFRLEDHPSIHPSTAICLVERASTFQVLSLEHLEKELVRDCVGEAEEESTSSRQGGKTYGLRYTVLTWRHNVDFTWTNVLSFEPAFSQQST